MALHKTWRKLIADDNFRWRLHIRTIKRDLCLPIQISGSIKFDRKNMQKKNPMRKYKNIPGFSIYENRLALQQKR